jgi:hypothetical protein
LKRVLFLFSAAVCLTAVATQALAQSWPQQTIHFIISFGAGGGADIVGRILADAMQNRLGQPVVVENKPGAGGILGNELVASATPDGYTLGIMTAGQIIAAVTRKPRGFKLEVYASGMERLTPPRCWPENQGACAVGRGYAPAVAVAVTDDKIDYHWSAGGEDDARKYAAELEVLAPDVILSKRPCGIRGAMISELINENLQ